jgi:formyltetrahydrofolate deformylase
VEQKSGEGAGAGPPGAASGPTAILLVSCPDRRGIVAGLSDFVFRHGGDIVHAEQHTDQLEKVFFQRIEFRLDGFDLGREEIRSALAPILEEFSMDCAVRFSDQLSKVGILVSKQAHCLYDLLARWRMGEMPADIPLIISNHPDNAGAASHFGVPYHCLPVTPDTKAGQERAMLRLLDEAGVDLVVLARYMQILSPQVVDRYPQRIINIHHSFLPAFVGARPYHQAYDRGVKLIGVTAHYATLELDQGPIIAQDVVTVGHRDNVEELIRKGRDLEMVVLARAVRFHLTHRVLVYGNKTVVFS